ncbi:replication protein [Desulfofalx alkaliphila]|uniref:replication protein n=1 Tax=Desulfofalx alkaliphila TaxID=105483 RepID=UPI00068ADD63|nr:replication protein [Desulfofalx alkaliphila]
MAKGDQKILKADTDDGFTKIANLLLEALAMCKINGTQKSMCLFLLRRTYGWGKSEDAISLSDFATACGTSNPYISRQIKDLLQKNIIKRVSYEPGKTPVYAFNTKIDEWDSNCIDLQKLIDNVNEGIYNCEGVAQKDKGYPIGQGLSKEIRQGLHNRITPPLSDCARVNQPQTLDTTGLDPPLNKVLKKYKEINNNNNNAREENMYSVFAKELGRPLSPMEVERIKQWSTQLSDELIIEALRRSVLMGKVNFRYIDAILLNWTKNNLRTIRDVRERDKQFKQKKSKTVYESPGDKSRSKPEGFDFDALLMS